MIGIESGKHFACAAFVRTTVVTIIPSPLQRLHGFGYNGIVRIHLSTWLVLQLEGSVHSVPRDVTLPSLDRGRVSFRGCEGGRGESASGAAKGEGGRVSFQGCEGDGGQLPGLGVKLLLLSSVFFLGVRRGEGGESASGGAKGTGQLWSCVGNCRCCRLLSFLGGAGGGSCRLPEAFLFCPTSVSVGSAPEVADHTHSRWRLGGAPSLRKG